MKDASNFYDDWRVSPDGVHAWDVHGPDEISAFAIRFGEAYGAYVLASHAPSEETICPQCGWDTLTRSWQHAPKASEAAH